MNNAVIFSSASDEWTPPQNLIDQLNSELDFEIDLAATAENTKCASFYSLQLDSLSQHWGSRFARGWLNPPYSRGLCGHFIEKAARQRRMGFLTVMLLPSRTDTKAFHAHIYDIDTWQPRNGIEIRLLAGRLRFSNSKTPAPFPSMIVIFRPDTQ